jgi:hypothetical protein
MPSSTYLLYIDILGFSDLVKNKSPKITKLFDIIDKLNVWGHTPYFKCIVFSDTILIYQDIAFEDETAKQREKTIMWFCEFAQNLFYKTISLHIHFRAILTLGEFQHIQHTHYSSFHGSALIKAYEEEKSIKAMGLFIDEKLACYSNIFKLTKYDAKYYFVHIMQNLKEICVNSNIFNTNYPINNSNIISQGIENLIAYDLYYLKSIFNMRNQSIEILIKQKYSNTWSLIHSRHPRLLNALAINNFNFSKICQINWNSHLNQIGTVNGYFG